MSLFDINTIFFEFVGYSMSYLEFFGVLFGLLAIYLSAKGNVLTWPVGLVNVVLAFLLYYQIRLYPDMLLQLFFLFTNVIGWWRWTHPHEREMDANNQLRVSFMSRLDVMMLIGSGVVGMFLLAYIAQRLHIWFPSAFQHPSDYPYIDSCITVMSIVNTYYVIQKKIESWVVWIIVDIMAACLYYVKGVKFYSFEYIIFTGLSVFGLLKWLAIYRHYKPEMLHTK